MFKHKDIWRGIDRLASSFGYSPSGLAKKAGLDPTSFNKSKRISPDGKPRWPSTESLSKVLAVTDTTMSDFISLIGVEDNSHPQKPPAIPLIGFAQAGLDGYFDEDGYPHGDGWDEIDFPAPSSAKDDNTYALSVSGDSMEPLYREGDTLIVSPNSKIKKGDRIIVKTNNGEVLAKELLKRGKDSITLHSANPAFEDRQISNNDITWTARIIWVSQ